MSLRLEGVTVRYGATDAISDVTFEIGPAERVAVLGPSGSGKSTLLRAVAGLEPLVAGQISWKGQDLASVPAHRRAFGLMFQDYSLFPHRDVRGNVAFGLEMRGDARSAIDARVAEVLELVGLSGFERRLPSDISGGEQQRVALARALAPTPRLLMLDEPLGALDRALRAELLDELDAIFTRLSLPIIYVTHDQEEALAIGDRVCVLRGGVVEALMPPRELWRSPPNEFVARFLGMANIFAAQSDGRDVQTPWGGVAVARSLPPGEHRLLLRPDGLVVDDSGLIRGTVRSSSFRGADTRLEVETDGSGPSLEVIVPGSAAPEVGETIRLRVAPEAIVVLPD
ncbi:MAG TPA: ABC transporter ATP-binding protein [Candidatus Limnocylindrales bacterium]|nr:ABC transporter ATP-binding protein [Candidatus Limnocylindrales bacterium]